jgi:hypothetical protein
MGRAGTPPQRTPGGWKALGVGYQDRRASQPEAALSWRGLSLRKDDGAGYRIFDRHVGRLQAQMQAQDDRRALPAVLFPMLGLQPLSMALAGTDSCHHAHFVQASEGQRRLIQTATSQDLIDSAGKRTDYVAPADLWQRIPALAYTAPGAAWAMQGQWRNPMSLRAWTLVCCALAGCSLRRLGRHEGRRSRGRSRSPTTSPSTSYFQRSRHRSSRAQRGRLAHRAGVRVAAFAG